LCDKRGGQRSYLTRFHKVYNLRGMASQVAPEELTEAFAANVRARRLALGLTQEELADRLGKHKPYISEIENGKRTPWLPNLANFAEALETTPSALLRQPKNSA
jgi:ribosome-binding protein aMBF1 (putative translation factor)